MPDWNFFVRGMDYDLWANKQWHACLLGKGLPQPDINILAHILSAQEIWLQRIQGGSPTAMPEIEPTVAEMERLNDGWRTALLAETDNRVIEYRRTTGESLRLPMTELGRHVINHGTYHRGELRGLCLARGDNDYPETDYALFALTAE